MGRHFHSLFQKGWKILGRGYAGMLSRRRTPCLKPPILSKSLRKGIATKLPVLERGYIGRENLAKLAEAYRKND